MCKTILYRKCQTGKILESWKDRQKIGRMKNLVKGPKMAHKKHLTKTIVIHTDKDNDITVYVEPMKLLLDKYDVLIPRKSPKAKIQK